MTPSNKNKRFGLFKLALRIKNSPYYNFLYENERGAIDALVNFTMSFDDFVQNNHTVEELERALHAKERELADTIWQRNQTLSELAREMEMTETLQNQGKADKITGCLGINEGAPIPQQDCMCLPCEVARERGYDEKNQWSP